MFFSVKQNFVYVWFESISDDTPTENDLKGSVTWRKWALETLWQKKVEWHHQATFSVLSIYGNSLLCRLKILVQILRLVKPVNACTYRPFVTLYCTTKNVDLSKLKVFTGDNLAQMTEFLLERVQIACYQSVLTLFSKVFHFMFVKTRECLVKGYCWGGLVVRASTSWAGGCGFDPWLWHTKVFESGSSCSPPYHSGLCE